jgi:hypothetical protein
MIIQFKENSPLIQQVADKLHAIPAHVEVVGTHLAAIGVKEYTPTPEEAAVIDSITTNDKSFVLGSLNSNQNRRSSSCLIPLSALAILS